VIVMAGLDRLAALQQRLAGVHLPHLGLDRLLAAHEDGCRALRSESKVFWAGFLWLVFLVQDLSNSLLSVELPHFVPANLSRSTFLQSLLRRISLQYLFVGGGSEG
jgi:hypothetical protein